MTEADLAAEKPVAIGDWVYAHTRKYVAEGDLKPGARIRVQTISERLGVSATPVREALLRLAQEDLVTATGSRGFAVPRLTLDDFEHLFELRRLLEPAAFVSVARTGRAEAMAESIARGEQAHERGDIPGFGQANADFRSAWFGQVGNPRLLTALRLYDDHFIHLRRQTHLSQEVRAILLKGHREMTAAVARHDPAAAQAAIDGNLDQAHAAMLSAIR